MTDGKRAHYVFESFLISERESKRRGNGKIVREIDREADLFWEFGTSAGQIGA